jgi:uncharacterized YigZ family protein
MKSQYSSILGPSTASLKIQGSKFIGKAFPVSTRDEAETVLEKVRKEYFDATHHCYAYALGSVSEETRFDDDGEPGGTAGVKIASAIKSSEMSDLIVVVTRYFGGTKLGVGGLGRAYYESAERTLNNAKRSTKILANELILKFAYSDTNSVMSTVSVHNIKVLHAQYDEDVTLHLAVIPEKKNELERLLRDITHGNIAIHTLPHIIVTAG